MKHKLFTLLAAVMITTSMWATVINGIDYTLNDGNLTATVSSNNKSYSGSNLVIPATVSYNSKTYTVNEIWYYAFDGNKNITSVTLPGTITSSNNGSYAFRNCTSLTKVVIEEGFSGEVLRWFNGCSALTSISIPSTLKITTQYTFDGCSSLQDVYVHWASLSGNEVQTYTFSGITLSNVTLHVPAGTESLYASTSPWRNFNIVPEERALGGAFSISSGKQVHFSKGNLQYKAITATWRFAENQYDYIGTANANISASYTGWIDMFGWSTVNSPTTSEDYVALYPSSFTDWGTKSIVNGCNAPNKWRTLTSAEWNYIVNSRSTTSGIRYAKATVNGVTGLILLPDDWSTSYYALSSTNTETSAYSSNNISLTNWTNNLEAHGAVFLPAAGFRYGTGCQHIGVDCVYWSSTPESGDDIYDMYVYETSVALQWHRRSLGCSVRLVCDKYTVAYDVNEGTGAVPSAQIKYTGDNITLSNNTLTRTGYSHVGWNTNEEGTGTHYNKGATYSENANATLYAEWELLPEASITTAPTAIEGLVYTGSAQELVNAGVAAGGELQYKLDDGAWGTTIPTAINAGTYTVSYRVVADSDHRDNAGSSVEVTIGKPNYAITANPDPQHPDTYYSTFYYELFKYVIPSGVEAYAATIGESDLYLKKIAGAGDILPEATAVILKSMVAGYTMVPTDNEAIVITEPNALQGTDEEKSAPANCYVLSGHSSDNSVTGVGFYQYTGTLKAHRAYVVVGSSSAPKRMRFVFDTETGIDPVTDNPSPVTRKILRDGQLIIIRGDREYNTQGQIIK